MLIRYVMVNELWPMGEFISRALSLIRHQGGQGIADRAGRHDVAIPRTPKTPAQSRRVPVSLAGTYLSEAVECLRSCNSAERLFPPPVLDYNAEAEERRNDALVATILAMLKNRRMDHVRNGVLFCALAAEAYINEFLTYHFDGKDRDALERLATPDKYLLAPRLALGSPLFERDQGHGQELAELFAIRHDLVHPKPGRGGANVFQLRPEDHKRYTPKRLAAFIETVAEAAVLLYRSRAGELEWPAHTICEGRRAIRRFAAKASASIAKPNDPPEPDLMAQVVEEQFNRPHRTRGKKRA